MLSRRTAWRGTFLTTIALGTVAWLLSEHRLVDAQGGAFPSNYVTPSSTFQVMHQLPRAASFVPRGEITITTQGAKETVAFVDRTSAKDREALRQLLADATEESGSELYRILVRIPGKNETEARSATSLCMLRAASLNDEVNIHIDSDGQAFHVDYNALAHNCDAAQSTEQTESFSTKVKIVRPLRGPRPLGDMPASAKPKVEFDKEGNIKKPEPEKSFIQKYWMYLVPILIMFLLSPNDAPNQGGNAGGGAVGGAGGVRAARQQ